MGRQQEWFQQLKELSKFAQDEAFHLVVQTKIPLFQEIKRTMSSEAIAMCVEDKYFWFNSGALKDCRRPFWVPREASPSFSDKIKMIADQHSTTWLFDTESLLCDGSGCSTHTEDNVGLYRDQESHLSKWGQLLLSPHFAALLERLPGPPPPPGSAEASTKEPAKKAAKGGGPGAAPAATAGPAAASAAKRPSAAPSSSKEA